MRPFIKVIITAAVSCILIAMASCSTSHLVNVWNDPEYHDAPLKKVFIIAVRKNPVQRRIWEDAFVTELSECGVKAFPSYSLFPDELPDTAKVIQTIQEKGFDGILVTRLLNKATETNYIESSVTTEIRTRYSPLKKRYTSYFQEVQHPGYVESSDVYRKSIELWRVRDMDNVRIVWGATSNSPERNSVKDVQNDIAELVIPDLIRCAIIEAK